MEPFDFTQSFIERSKQTASTQALTAAFQDALERLGFRYFACCSHVDPLKPPRPAVMLHNYPSEWVRAYSKRKLHETDPVFLHAERTIMPFFWDAPDFRARITAPQQHILAQAADLGIVGGYTIPIHLPWTPAALRASCSVIPDSRSIAASSYFAVQLMAMHLYDAASRAHAPHSVTRSNSVLSLRERQCLELAAQGKSNWTIGQLLSISEHTVHRHIESAKQRLGVATRVQAIIRALHGGEIGDVTRADAGSGHAGTH